jgi:hypothetical protein
MSGVYPSIASAHQTVLSVGQVRGEITWYDPIFGGSNTTLDSSGA